MKNVTIIALLCDDRDICDVGQHVYSFFNDRVAPFLSRFRIFSHPSCSSTSLGELWREFEMERKSIGSSLFIIFRSIVGKRRPAPLCYRVLERMTEVGEPFFFATGASVHSEVRQQQRRRDERTEDTRNKRKKGLTAPATRRGVEMPASIISETMTDRHRYPGRRRVFARDTASRCSETLSRTWNQFIKTRRSAVVQLCILCKYRIHLRRGTFRCNIEPDCPSLEKSLNMRTQYIII